MAYKRPFYDVMQEFIAEHPDEVANLTIGQIAERTGYSLKIVSNYFFAKSAQQYARDKRAEEEEQIRAKEGETYTYITSSGKARVDYYPYIGEVKITNAYGPGQTRFSWNTSHDPWIMLSPQDALEVGTYLAGLQPHIREVLARKEQPVPQEPLKDEQEDDQPDEAVSDD